MSNKPFRFLICLIGVLFLGACTAGGMKNIDKSGFLGDYSQLKTGEKDRAALIYIKSGVDFKRYKKLMFDRIVVALSPKASNREIDPAILKEMTDYYQNALFEAVKDGYEIVDQPGPDVAWVRVAITDIVPAKPVANTLSTVIPVGMAVSAVAKVASDANLGTGEAATEIEVLDSITKVRLAAAVDRRQGGKMAFRGKWGDTKQAFDHWAKRFRERLDEAQQ